MCREVKVVWIFSHQVMSYEVLTVSYTLKSEGSGWGKNLALNKYRSLMNRWLLEFYVIVTSKVQECQLGLMKLVETQNVCVAAE